MVPIEDTRYGVNGDLTWHFLKAPTIPPRRHSPHLGQLLHRLRRYWAVPPGVPHWSALLHLGHLLKPPLQALSPTSMV